MYIYVCIYDLRNLQEIYNPRTNLVNIDKIIYFNYACLWTEISKDLPSELDEYIFFPSLKKNCSMNMRLKNSVMLQIATLANLQRKRMNYLL